MQLHPLDSIDNFAGGKDIFACVMLHLRGSCSHMLNSLMMATNDDDGLDDQVLMAVAADYMDSRFHQLILH